MKKEKLLKKRMTILLIALFLIVAFIQVAFGSLGSSYRQYGTLSDGRKWEKVFFTANARNDPLNIEWQQGYVSGALDFSELSSIDPSSVQVVITNAINFDHYQIGSISGKTLSLYIYIKDKNAYTLWVEGYVYAEEPRSTSGTPDLTVTYPVQFSPSTVSQGGSLTVSWTEKNQGSGSAGSYSTGVYLGVSEYGKDYLLGRFTRSGLGAGQSASYTALFTIPQSIPLGSYYVTVFIDDLNAVAESNENNNIGSSTPSKVNVASNTGTIRVIVHYVDGVAASNAKVYVDGQLKGYTDSSGTLMVSVPAGTHSVQVVQDVMGITNKYVSDTVSISVPIGMCVDAKVVLKCQGGCVKITSGSASPSSAKPGDAVTVTVKYVFFHCCSACCIVKANAFGDWAKTTQLAVVHDGCEGTFHTEITKTFTFTLPATISPGTHYVRVGFNYDYSFKSSYDDLASTEHIDIPINVAACTTETSYLDGQITGVNPSSVSVSLGQSVQFTFTVKNTGNVVADYHVYFPDGSLFGYVSGTITLNPGQQGQITLTGTVPSGAQPGSYSVDVYFEMAQHGQTWQKTRKWGTVQVNVQGPQPGYVKVTITNNDDDTVDVYLYIDGALKLTALSRSPGSTFTSDPISVQGNTQHTVTIKWRDPDTSQEYSKSVNVYVPQRQTVTATLSIDLHTAGLPRLEITHNFPSQVTSGSTFAVTVAVRNSGTADATNVASGISWGGDAFSSLGCTGTWRKDRLALGEVMQYTCSLKAGKPGTYTVEVSAVADSGVSAKSTVQVAVLEARDTTPPSVKVLAPAGGESLTPGSTYRIKWQATDNVGVAKISIYLYQASGPASVIASNISNTGYYDWTVPDNPGSYYIRIVAVDTSGNTATADSPQFIIIQRQQQTFNVQIAGYTAPSTASPGQTVTVQLTIKYDFPSTSYVDVAIGQQLPDGSWKTVWYNPDYQTRRSGRGTLTYSATFTAPSQPSTYKYRIRALYWDGSQWKTTDEKYFSIQIVQQATPVEVSAESIQLSVGEVGSSAIILSEAPTGLKYYKMEVRLIPQDGAQQDIADIVDVKFPWWAEYTDKSFFNNDVVSLSAIDVGDHIRAGDKGVMLAEIIIKAKAEGTMRIEFYISIGDDKDEEVFTTVKYGILEVKAKEYKVWTDKPVYYIGENINIHVSPTPAYGVGFWLMIYSPNYAKSRYNLSIGENVVSLRAGYPTGQYKVELWGAVIYPGAEPKLYAYCYFEVRESKPPTLILFEPQISGLTVTINGVANPGYEGASITRIHWDWGDGSSEDRWFPATHTYSSAGTYTMTVTVYQSDGLTTAKTITVTLQAENKPPVADFSYSPSNPVAGDRVSFTDKSYDPDGRIASWLWEFGDGASSREKNPTHIYSSPGIYMVMLTVKDDKGVEAVARKLIYVGETSARVEIKIDQNRIDTLDLGSATEVTIPFTLTNKDSFTRHVYVCVKGSNVECLSSKEFILAPNEIREDKINLLVLNDPTQRITRLIVEVKDFNNHLTISSDYANIVVGDCGLPPNAEIELPSPAQGALKLIAVTNSSGCVVKVHKAYRVQLTVDNPSKLSFNYLELRYSKPLSEKVLICAIDQVNPIPTDLQGVVEKVVEKLLEKYAPALLPVLKPIAALKYVKCITGPDKILPLELQTKEVLIPGSGEFYLVAYNTEGKIIGVTQKWSFDVWDGMPLKNINVKIMPVLDMLIPSKISSVNGQSTEFFITIVNNSPDYLSGNSPQFVYDESSLSILPKNPNIDLRVWHLSPGQSIVYTFVLKPLKNGTHKVKVSLEDSLGQIQIVKREMEVNVYSAEDVIKDTMVKVSPNKIKPGDTFDAHVSFNVDFSIISSLHNIEFVPVGASVKPVEVKVELFEEKAMLWLFDRKIAEKSIRVDSSQLVASEDVFFNLHDYDLGWWIFHDGDHKLYAKITVKYCVGTSTCIYGTDNNWSTLIVETPRITVQVKS